MEIGNFSQTRDTFKEFPLLSSFDFYYLGFFEHFLTSKYYLRELIELAQNVIQLHHQETIGDQDKVKSLVRIFTKKIDASLIGGLELKIDDNNEGRITLKDYLLSIMDALPKYKEISHIELYYIGRFHAICPSFKILNLLADVNQINQILHTDETPQERVVELLLKSLNKKIVDTNGGVANGNNQEANLQNFDNSKKDVSSPHKEEGNERQNNLKRKAEDQILEVEFKKVKMNNQENLGEGELITINLSKQNKPTKTNTESTSVSDPVQQNQDATNKEEIPPELLAFLEAEKEEQQLLRTSTKDEEELSKALIEQLLQADQAARPGAKEEEELTKAYLEELRQQEEKEKVQQKEKLEEQNSANCAICLDDLYSTSFKPLEGCSHVFHEECMQNYLKSKIDDKDFPIVCPDLECKSEIRLSDVTDFLDPAYQEKFESFSFKSYLEKNADEVSCCPTADCPFAFVKEDEQTQLECPVCKKHYCLNCRVEWHKGMSCKEYEISHKKDENDEKFEKFLKGKKYKQCPKCGFWVSRIDGCNAMICRCKTQFCYNCGKEGDGHVCPCLRQNRPPLQLARPLGGGGLFQNNNFLGGGNLFQNPVQPLNNIYQGGLFGNPYQLGNPYPNYQGGLFGNQYQYQNGLFGNQNQNNQNLNRVIANPNGLFNNLPPAYGLNPIANQVPVPGYAGGIFRNQNTTLFPQNNNNNNNMNNNGFQ